MKYSLYFLFYLFLLCFIGLSFRKKLKTIEDFFLANRSLSAVFVFFSLTASWIGATSTLVATEEAFYFGISSFWIMGFPSILTVVLFAFFLVRRIRTLPFVSLPDLIEMRYGKKVRHITSILIIWYMVLLAASQMVAGGKFLSSTMETNYYLGLLICTGIVLLYSIAGGFFSVVFTDGLQLFLIWAGILASIILLTKKFTFSGIISLAREQGGTDFFNIFNNWPRNSLICLSFVLAWLISPIAWQRIQSAKSVSHARSGLYSSAAALFIYFTAILFLGIGLLSLFPERAPDKLIISSNLLEQAGTVLGPIVFVAIMAAIMSTMDTAINTGALSLTRDIFQQFSTGKNEANIVGKARLSTFFLGAMALVISTRLQSILQTLGLASEIMAEGLFIPGMAMLFSRKKRPSAGMLSLVLGGGFAFVGFLCQLRIIPFSWPEWPYSLPWGIGFGLAGFIIGLLIDKRKLMNNPRSDNKPISN